MKYQPLDIKSGQYTSCFLESAFILENENAFEEYFVIPNDTIGIYVIVQGEGFHSNDLMDGE